MKARKLPVCFDIGPDDDDGKEEKGKQTTQA